MYTEFREKTAVNGTLQVHVERQQSKNSLRFADISGIGSEKNIPYFELWPFVSSNRGYAWPLHLPFAQQTIYLFLKGQFIGICSC